MSIPSVRCEHCTEKSLLHISDTHCPCSDSVDACIEIVKTDNYSFGTCNYNFLGNASSAKVVIIIALIWRWTGYNMVFFLAGLQNIEYSVYEAAKIDGASGWQTFWSVTVPLLKPTIVMTAIMSINGTLQLFDESVNLTSGGPANGTITMSHYVYNNSFGEGVADFGYASAMSFFIFILVAILAFINLKVGDSRD